MHLAVALPTNDVSEIFVDGRHLATFDLDHFHQLDSVTIYETNTTPEEQLAVLKLAANHVREYVVHRTSYAFGGILQATTGNRTRDLQRSHELLKQSALPSDIEDKDSETLKSALKESGITVIMAVYANHLEALDAIVSNSLLEGHVGFGIIRKMAWGNQLLVRFTADPSRKFTFWKAVWRNGDLDVIPVYHPAMAGRHYSNLINGATNVVIGGESVRDIYPPTDLDAPLEEFTVSSPWGKLPHPYKVDGRCFEASIEMRHILSVEGSKTLVDLLASALDLDGDYVAVSGGFNSPYAYPGNVVQQYGIRPEGGRARGSEAHCAWAYYTLQDEGCLDGSIIPAWLHSEGWLSAYPHPSKVSSPG